VECLNERLEELRAQVDVLSRADASTVSKAVQAVRALPRFDACADAAALRAPVRPPNADARVRVEGVRVEIAQAKALQRAGSYEAATTIATKATDEASALAYRPVEAETTRATTPSPSTRCAARPPPPSPEATRRKPRVR
jgi:hypothetical protein